MASYYWIKLYHEILEDPKMGQLPDRVWRRCIELFLLAGDVADEGTLPPVEDMAWRLRISEDALLEDLAALESVGIVTRNGDTWTVTNFASRQGPVCDAERMAQYRDRQRKAEYYNDYEKTDCNEDGNEPVTSRNTELDTDTESEADTDQETDSGADAPPVRAPPANLQDWLGILRQDKNRNAVLRRMFIALYPDHDAPDFGYLGRVAKGVGGAARLADLLWHASARPPNGDVLAYIQATEKRRKQNAPHQRDSRIIPKPPAQPIDPAQVERDRAALREHRARQSGG